MTSASTGQSERLLTVAEAAEYLNTSVRFVRRLISQRRIAYVKLGRHVRIAEADIRTFVDDSRLEALTAADVWEDVRGVA